MLQFIATESDRYSIAEQMQMAIEGGCAWIQLHLPDATDEEIREIAAEAIPLCRETSTILMLEDRPALAKELGLHGVHITDPATNMRALRDELGPEAIIGTDVTTAQAVLMLKSADIDYATVAPALSADDAKALIAMAHEAGSETPIVVTGNFLPDNVDAAMATGASGIATGRAIMQANDPVACTEELLARLNNAQ